MCSESCSKLFKNKRLEFMKDHLARNQDFDRKKNNDSIRIFAGDWLSYSILFISWRSFAGSFWIINLKDDPSKFDWKFFLNFFTFLFRFFYSISSGVSQYPFRISPRTIQEQVIRICRKKLQVWTGS